jgi:D-glycero-alpha-D-manno-heptose 1-phosphate guanylyltransferase
MDKRCDQAIVLVGGQGTRLKSISGDVPKPMVDVAEQPFLYHVLEYLEKQGFTKIVLACGYNAEYIQRRVEEEKPIQCEVVFSIEDEPLGTGGAIKLASEHITSEYFVVLNGDSIFDVDLADFVGFSLDNDCSLCIGAAEVEDVSRYGQLQINEEYLVTAMGEKKGSGAGVINSGVYLIKSGYLNSQDTKFSFEKSVLETQIGCYHAFPMSGYFIDIGIPEDYYKAGTYFSNQ